MASLASKGSRRCTTWFGVGAILAVASVIGCSSTSSDPDAMCVAGDLACGDDGSYVCVDGRWELEDYCDPLQGLRCEPTFATCVGSCRDAEVALSYTGCEYFPTVTANEVPPEYGYAVVVANTSNELAWVHIDGGALDTPIEFSVTAGSVIVQELPWVDELKMCRDPFCIFGGPTAYSARVTGGAYHLRATQPVTVYQFNPLRYTLGDDEYSESNDASLLLPSHTWRNRFVVASWPQFSLYPSTITITAKQPNTAVTVTTRADTVPEPGVPGFIAGQPQTIILNAGDVFQMATRAQTAELVAGDDLTGSVVTSDKPVQVISGHLCTYVPTETGACDHLEESIFGVETLSNEYFVTTSALPSLPDGKLQFTRIIATEPDTAISYDPPQDGAPVVLDQVGDFAQVLSRDDFAVVADKKVLVAQYLTGQEVEGGSGDPALTLAVPIGQYRRDYLFHAPTNYEHNYVNIIAPTGATVMLDGQAVTAFTAIGSSDWGVAKIELDNTGSGNHRVSGSDAFGIGVYGYGRYTSYRYPGGLDLEELVVEID